MGAPTGNAAATHLSLHRLGVVCGLAAGAWLGIAEAPMKLVVAGFSPFVVTIGMVLGVFIARWTVPMMLKGAGYVFVDVWEKKHLVAWGLLAGMLWAVANTLTVFAIRDIGLSIAFPLWNVNALIGLFWGWLLFNELRGGAARQRWLVLGGAILIITGACLTARATLQHSGEAHAAAVRGILAASGAALLWGTMYIPYRKAYISGMNPLSFVTIFTFGELGTTFALGAAYHDGIGGLTAQLALARPVMFWLFLGGLCWVLGDLFQHYAAKYVGIARGIPLSNTNQLWGLAWGALVYGELAHLGLSGKAYIIGGSLVMMLGVVAISLSEAGASEQAAARDAMERECARYGLDREEVAATLEGHDPLEGRAPRRRPWELLLAAAAAGVFVWLGFGTQRQDLPIDLGWLAGLSVAALGVLAFCGTLLWKRTRFS
ncbi:MAG TPA: GRP family sugar transporter [Lacunisphaera sp.]|nr:GRP family sugar transporter [Lacunisphaera sp.]